jgi:hypothetical protein
MHWTHEIDPLHRVSIVTVSGELTDEGLSVLYNKLQDVPGVGPDFALVLDLRRASGRKVLWPSGPCCSLRRHAEPW